MVVDGRYGRHMPYIHYLGRRAGLADEYNEAPSLSINLAKIVVAQIRAFSFPGFGYSWGRFYLVSGSYPFEELYCLNFFATRITYSQLYTPICSTYDLTLGTAVQSTFHPKRVEAMESFHARFDIVPVSAVAHQAPYYS